MTFLERLLPSVHPAEKVRFQHAAVALAFVAAAAVVARTAGTALLLDAFDARLLPWMYAGTAGIVVIAAFGLSSLLHRGRADRVVALVSAVAIVACIVVRLGIGHGGAFAAAAYVLADCIARIVVGLFWGLVALLFNAREARRVIGLLGAAGTVACLAAATWIPGLASAFGAKNLLVVVALLVAGFAVAVITLIRRDPAAGLRLTTASAETPLLATTGGNGAALRVPLVRNVALLMALGTFTLCLNDYVFVTAVREIRAGDDLAAFLGHFYAVASVMALAIQLIVLPWLLRTGGVLAALAALPGALLLAAAGVALTGAFPLVYIAKLTEPVLLFTVDAAAVQLVYQGLRKPTRFRVRTLVDGVSRPVAIALAAIVLLAAGSFAGTRGLAFAIVVACAGWLYLARRCAASYVQGLLELLGARGLDLNEGDLAHCDPALAQHLRERLLTAPDGEIPYLLELVQDSKEDWSLEHVALLKRDTPLLRVAGLEYLARHRRTEHADACLACVTDPSPAVRAAAVDAAARLLGSAASPDLAALLSDDDHDVRARTAAALIEAGGGDAARCDAVLRDMLGSDDVERRVAAGRALARVTGAGFDDALESLLHDEAPAAALAALQVLVQRPRPGLARAIVPLLARPDLVACATEALVAAGPACIPPLEAAARSPDTPVAVRSRLPLVLSSLGPAALPAIGALVDARESHVSRLAIRATCRILVAWPSAAEARGLAETTARREAERAVARLQDLERLRRLPATQFLVAVIEEEHRAHLDDCFMLLDATRPDIDVAALRRHVVEGSADERADAIELLDNVLGPTVRSQLLSLLEDSHHSRGGNDHAVLHQLARASRSEWVVAGAVHACCVAPTIPHAPCSDLAVALLAHPSARVRETALDALGRVADPASVRHHAQSLADDRDPAVRGAARLLAHAPGEAGDA